MSTDDSSKTKDLTGIFELTQEAQDTPADEPALGTLTPPLPTEHSEPLVFETHQTIPTAEHTTPQEPKTTLETLKDYSERSPVGQPSVPAAYPFTLLIRGRLNDLDKEKLLDLLKRESMGFSEFDLEPMFEAGKILLPQISEYAGVLIVQALRDAPVDFHFAPADSEAEGLIFPEGQNISAVMRESAQSGPDALPLSTGATLPGVAYWTAIESITATALLKASSIESKHSSEYTELLEALQREIKHKAYHKGANAVLHFSVSLTPLSDSSSYRVTAIGTAVRTQTQSVNL